MKTSKYGEEILSIVSDAEQKHQINRLLFQDYFVNENILKMHCTLLVFYLFSPQCQDMESAIKNKKYEFLLFVKDRADIKMIETIQTKLGNKAQDDEIAQSCIEEKLKGIAKGHTILTSEAQKRHGVKNLISDVTVFPYKKIKELKIKLRKLFPNDKPV